MEGSERSLSSEASTAVVRRAFARKKSLSRTVTFSTPDCGAEHNDAPLEVLLNDAVRALDDAGTAKSQKEEGTSTEAREAATSVAVDPAVRGEPFITVMPGTPTAPSCSSDSAAPTCPTRIDAVRRAAKANTLTDEEAVEVSLASDDARDTTTPCLHSPPDIPYV